MACGATLKEPTKETNTHTMKKLCQVKSRYKRKTKKLYKSITSILKWSEKLVQEVFTSGWGKVVLLIMCFSSNILVLLQEWGNALLKKICLTVFSQKGQTACSPPMHIKYQINLQGIGELSPFPQICNAPHRWHHNSSSRAENFISVKQFIYWD